MLQTRIFIGIFCLAFLMAGCKTEFEKIKGSTDPKAKYAKAKEYYEKSEWTNCQLLLDDVIPMYRASGESENIAWMYANCTFNLKEYMQAAYAFKQFVNTFPTSKHAEDALFLSANASYKQSPTSLLDQEPTNQAIESYQIFINTYPGSLRVEEANGRIDELRAKLYQKDFEAAALYYKVGDYQSAVHSIKSLLKKYPDARDAETARFMIVKANYNLATNSIESKQQERFQNTINSYLELVDKHPGGKMTKDAERYFDLATKRIKELKNGN